MCVVLIMWTKVVFIIKMRHGWCTGFGVPVIDRRGIRLTDRTLADKRGYGIYGNQSADISKYPYTVRNIHICNLLDNYLYMCMNNLLILNKLNASKLWRWKLVKLFKWDTDFNT